MALTASHTSERLYVAVLVCLLHISRNMKLAGLGRICMRGRWHTDINLYGSLYIPLAPLGQGEVSEMLHLNIIKSLNVHVHEV